MLGVYLLGAGYGAHEVTNYLHERFCPDEQQSPLCQIVIFNDDEFSHWIFFAGFVLTNTAVLLIQVIFPRHSPLQRRDLVWLIANSLFIALGIFANLAFEEIGFDLYVITFLALLAQILLWRPNGRKQPLVIYYATAYTVGLLATFIVKNIGA